MTNDALAGALLRARFHLEPLAAAEAPATLHQAYAVQDAMAAQLGEIGGWKIGASTPADQPLFAPMPRAWMSGGVQSGRLRGVEVEIAFLLGHDLPPRAHAYTRDQVAAAVASAHPAIEIIESGLEKPDAVPRLLKIADLQIHGGFVAGPPIANWRDIDWAQESASLYVNAGLNTQRTGSNTAGDLLRLLLYLANEGSARTQGLHRGQWITTGSWTGVTFCAPGDQAAGRFAHSDTVRVRFR